MRGYYLPRRGISLHRLAPITLALALLLPAAASAQDVPAIPAPGGVDVNTPAKRDAEPVVLRGSDLPLWSARSNQTVRLPFVDFLSCQVPDDDCPRNDYAPPHFDTGMFQSGGFDVARLRGYRYDAARRSWRQIPFQVDEVFERYLNNSASGFAFYSGEDKHTTYAYDREGFRWFENEPGDPCKAKPAKEVATDPIPGLDDNDELAFMYSDAGDRMPEGSSLPAGITEAPYEIVVSDPTDPTAQRYAYVMKASAEGPKAAFDAEDGYVSYKRDKIADTFERSVSSYSDYGNARRGPYCDKDGKLVVDEKGQPKTDRRRPRDYATIKTDRYRFRYDGRWLMTEINISPDGGKTYAPDVVDRWKARAFAQDPGSETPCCGFEEEDTNWGGSSTLLGERVGPVRAIRETWGADSGTNVIRRESFYRYEMRQKTWLRVHVIPPLDGIYAQWDFNATRMKRFYNSSRLEGVDVDGMNDEVFGNFDDPCNSNYDINDTSETDQGYRSIYETLPLCSRAYECPPEFEDPSNPLHEVPQVDPVDVICGRPYHQSIDSFDPTFSKANVALEWAEIAGPHGTIVDRIVSDVRDLTPGGAAQSVVATPYYRDDACFDDGTGTDPGPKVKLRSGDEPRTTKDGQPRACWRPQDGEPNSAERFFQGSIGTHGLHLLFLVDSDNARQTVPLNEIVSEWRMVMLPGDQTAGGRGPEAGQQYGEGFNAPVQPGAEPVAASSITDSTAPTVKLRARRHPSHHRIHLTYSVYDTGGSGLKSLTLQVRQGRKWKTIRTGVKRRKWNYKTKRSGRYVFRLGAEDNAGNRSKWKYARVTMRNSRFRGH
jgi:hypothetical protein